MTPLIHTTRPPNDDTPIIRFCPTASQMDPTVGWSAVGLSAITTKGKYCQSPDIKWGAVVVPHNGVWHVTPTPTDDAPSCWMLAVRLTDLLALALEQKQPQAPAAGPDLSQELEAARARLALLESAIGTLIESTKK